MLRASLEEYGFVFNRYDPCIANRMINGKQLTIRFHVDDVLASHMEQAVLEGSDLYKGTSAHISWNDIGLFEERKVEDPNERLCRTDA